eukprot:4367217-Alexandrium_andersonii.AAC.1
MCVRSACSTTEAGSPSTRASTILSSRPSQCPIVSRYGGVLAFGLEQPAAANNPVASVDTDKHRTEWINARTINTTPLLTASNPVASVDIEHRTECINAQTINTT